MLLNGVNHVAILTKDIDRLRAFYEEVFEAPASHQELIGDEISFCSWSPLSSSPLPLVFFFGHGPSGTRSTNQSRSCPFKI